MMLDNNTRTFFALVKSGLWEQEVRLSQFGHIDFDEVFRLAEEQSVVGLVTAGIEYIVDVKVPQEIVLQFIGSALQLEQQNLAMNEYVAQLIEQLRKEDVYAILVKGQGIAQCYERPMWRASGDVDLLLDDDDYMRAKELLLTKAKSIEEEDAERKHIGMNFDQWVVELHGTLHSRYLDQLNREVDIFAEGIV